MPRQKITASDLSDDLPDLTQKQRDFCAGILAGKTLTASYMAAYNCDKMSQAAIYCEASRLRAHPEIALWLDAVRTEALKAGSITLQDHLNELNRIKAIAIRTGNIGAAVQAEINRGKAGGLYVEQYADVTHDPIRALNRIAAELGDDVAAKLAKRDGIEWKPETATTH